MTIDDLPDLRGQSLRALYGLRDRLTGEAGPLAAVLAGERSRGAMSDDDLRAATSRYAEYREALDAVNTRIRSHEAVQSAAAAGQLQMAFGPGSSQATAAERYGVVDSRGGASSRAQYRSDPWGGRPAADLPTAELRGRAISAVAALESLPEPSREATTRSLEADDDPEQRMSRLILALSHPAYRSAWRRWFTNPDTGPHEWSPEERAAVRAAQQMRAMTIGSPGGGGYLVPADLDPQLVLAGTGSVDPMRRVSRVMQTAYNVKQLVTTLGVSASWDAESAEVSDDSPTLVQPSITCVRGQAYVQASYELDQDSDLGRQVGGLFADSKAQLEASGFTTGSGVGQPRGIITAVSAVAGSVVTVAANVLANSDPANNQAALPPRWRPNGRFMCNLSILNGYRALIKATGLTESLVDDSGPVPRMYGWEVVENSNMDGVLSAGAADYILLSGSFDQFVIVDRVGTLITPIPFVMGANRRPTGERGWHLMWRTGSDAAVPDAFRLTNLNS